VKKKEWVSKGRAMSKRERGKFRRANKMKCSRWELWRSRIWKGKEGSGVLLPPAGKTVTTATRSLRGKEKKRRSLQVKLFGEEIDMNLASEKTEVRTPFSPKGSLLFPSCKEEQ